MNAFRPSLALACLLLSGWTSYAQAPAEPGPEHLAIKRLAGQWIATVKDPSGDTKGTVTTTMECRDLWLITDFKAEMWGSPFQGRGIDGYDPATGKHISVWVDSMSTRPLVFEGTLDKAKKTLTMTATGTGMDGKPATFKSVTHYPNPDRQEFTLFLVGADGSEEKVVSIDYDRKK